MNERIKQLMEQALDEKFAGTWSVMDLEDLTKFADRFAELIQKDTIRSLRDMFQKNSTNWLILNAIIETGFKE